jgi:hypothetical protein
LAGRGNEIAYVPTKSAFKQVGYEVINSKLAPGAGELLVHAHRVVAGAKQNALMVNLTV